MHKQLPAQSARGTRICASKLFLLGVQFFLTGSVYAHTLQKQLLFIHIDDDGYMHSAATFASLATEGQIHIHTQVQILIDNSRIKGNTKDKPTQNLINVLTSEVCILYVYLSAAVWSKKHLRCCWITFIFTFFLFILLFLLPDLSTQETTINGLHVTYFGC